MIVGDCLRADHVSGFGYDRETTPTLEDLDPAAFLNAKAPIPWKFSLVSSLLSGQYLCKHGGCPDPDRRNLSAGELPQRPLANSPTLSDLLETAGYDTGLITAIPMTKKAVGGRFQHVSVHYTGASGRVDAPCE